MKHCEIEAPPGERADAPVGLRGVGEDHKKTGQHEHYHDPALCAIRRRRSAEERMILAIAAFNCLDGDEQHIFAERLARMYGFTERVEIDSFWMGRSDHRRALARSWRALPQADRREFLLAVTGGAAT